MLPYLIRIFTVSSTPTSLLIDFLFSIYSHWFPLYLNLLSLHYFFYFASIVFRVFRLVFQFKSVLLISFFHPAIFAPLLVLWYVHSGFESHSKVPQCIFLRHCSFSFFIEEYSSTCSSAFLTSLISWLPFTGVLVKTLLF